jgi:hypothetical protein
LEYINTSWCLQYCKRRGVHFAGPGQEVPVFRQLVDLASVPLQLTAQARDGTFIRRTVAVRTITDYDRSQRHDRNYHRRKRARVIGCAAADAAAEAAADAAAYAEG